MIKNLFIDLDDTIFDFHKAEHIAVFKALEEFGINPTKSILDRYSVINLFQWKLLEKGMITRAEVKVNRFKLLLHELNSLADPFSVAMLYEKYLSQGHYYMDGAHEAIVELSRKYNLYLVSNGTSKVQHGRLDSSDLQQYFKEIFISEEIGLNKPDIGFFDYGFSKIPGFLKNESLMIGDSLSSDILGGLNAGIKTVWISMGKSVDKEIVPDFVINGIKELPELLKNIAENQ
ncbi:MAG: YjjG family noncanonical pyrimidine nucleotidase [Bacilli bacterium]